MPLLQWLFGSVDDLPLGAAMGWRLDWLALHAVADAFVAIGFLVSAFGIVIYIRRRPNMARDYRTVAWLFASFIFAGGIAHLIGVVTLWYPVYGLEGVARAVTASLAILAVVLIWRRLPTLVRLPSSQELSEANSRLRREAESHEATLRELEAARSELESHVADRTRELTLLNARFQTALHGANVYLFSQDSDLRYTWLYSPDREVAAASWIGRTDDEVLPIAEREAVLRAKQQVLQTGQAEDLEVSFVAPERRGHFALHIDPTFNAEGQIDGLTCAAIDVSRIRSLESEQRRLTEELGTTLQRYETALHGSNITVFTQDRDLRYTTVSGPIFGLEPDAMLGRLDDEVLPLDSRGPIVTLKREVLASGQPRDGEFRTVSHKGGVNWYDIHMEPLRDVSGRLIGITCAAVDTTARKAGEAHLRDLMRELTHRSKNLLAVIQAMARQTARHAGTTDTFLDQFGARLQALAASHDLLVQESWYGASLTELARSQLGHHLDREGAQVSVQGPPLLLKPEAAQSLGLALHELATNAAKYGALSVPQGRVAVSWRRLPMVGSEAIEVLWTETGGPAVVEPGGRGFGRLVIERNLARTLEADVELTFPVEGVQCRITIPANHLAAGP